MKKAITILMVLCVSVALFASAGVTFKVGGAFSFVTGGTKDFVVKETTLTNSASKYTTMGAGFDLAGSFDSSKDLKVWTDLNMIFGFDSKYKLNSAEKWSSMNELYKEAKEVAGDSAYKKMNTVSAAAGVAYKLNFDAPVDVSVGGGLFFERIFGRVGVKEESYESGIEFKAINLGVSLYADAEYKFNDSFGISLTARPQFGLYNLTTVTQVLVISGIDGSTTMKAKGFSFGFSIPVSIGATFSL